MIEKVANILSEVSGQTLKEQQRIEFAIKLASDLFYESEKERSSKERLVQEKLTRMMADPKGRTFMTLFTDRSCRSKSAERTVDQLVYLLKTMGLPQFLNEKEKMQFFLFRSFGNIMPSFFLKQIKKQLHKEIEDVLIPSDREAFAKFNKSCQTQNIELNINHLGEAILGEEEAQRRLDRYLQDFDDPSITYVSVKISTLFSQINELAWDQTLSILEQRLSKLYQKAGKRFVNLDMEEYKDLDLTVELFKRVLSRDEFKKTYAGIVLQAYLPNAFEVQKELTAWAKNRGSPIKLRLVKGANLAMETVESSIRGWNLATFEKKIESDANFKRMLRFGMEHTDAVHLGIGSHNLFDIAYALILRAETNNEERVNFEMLSGMATSLQKVITKAAGKMVLYAPEASSQHFDHAIAYLIRRLDENGGPDNFLRDFFHLSKEEIWDKQAELFRQSCRLKIPSTSRREELPEKEEGFENEPDLDFSIEKNRKLAKEIMQPRSYERIPLVIAGRKIEGQWQVGIDPSNPQKPLYEYALATKKQIDDALAAAKLPQNPPLLKVAALMRKKKADLLHAMLADGGKSVHEGNGEVSEAIDFLEYYSRTRFPKNYEWKPRGTILVAPPWNFSVSIPVGGIAAALAAGNAVIFKPAPEAVLAGWTLVQLFWEAGVSQESLQFINCDDEEAGSYLIQHPKVAGVVLTGATATAKKFLQMRPDLYLMAETGGKNALIVTAMSDRDLAIRDAVRSAFGYSGQKCSACSLLILEKEVYDDESFMRQLKDAAQSLPVGSAWNPASVVTPLIRPAGTELHRALTTLEEGEEWLLKPHADPENPHLWSPGIKLHVKPGSFTHQTEFFGPLLAVMCADNLEHAIEMANGTQYGLTSGLHSLDVREQEIWKKKIVAGNLYINRTITGAIVDRQPFGGTKASSFGPGSKAGGRAYVRQLAVPNEIGLPNEEAPLPPKLAPILSGLHKQVNEEERAIFIKSVKSYAFWAKKYMTPVERSHVVGQKNLFYHMPKEKVVIHINPNSCPLDYLRAIACCHICQTPFEVSKDDSIEEGPVFASGELECKKYLREVSLSHDTHRYGYLIDDDV